MSFKSFVIRKPNDQFSEKLADECIASAKQFGIDVEKINGVYSDFDKLLTLENLKINPGALKKFNTNGVKGCFLSHWNLWNRCLKENIPFLIFEHDGLMINPLPDNVLDKFNDYLNLDYARHVFRRDMKNYENGISNNPPTNIIKLEPTSTEKSGFKFINRNHIVGAHGYILKPSGAKKIINGIKQDGICPADIAPNLSYIQMFYTNETVVRVNPIMLEKQGGQSHTKQV